MSLLMDALKRAEQANQRGHSKPPSATTPGLSEESVLGPTEPSALEHVPSPSSAPSALPQLPRLEDLDKEFIAHAQEQNMPRTQVLAPDRIAPQATSSSRSAIPPWVSHRPSVAAQPGEAAERESVRNAFAIKQRRHNKTPGLIAGVIGSLAVGAVGAYFWLQLRPVQGLALQGPSAVIAAQPSTAPVAIAPTEAQAIPPSGAPARSRAADRPRLNKSEPVTRTKSLELPQPRVSAPLAAADPIRITTSQVKVNPAANEGYLAFQSGNLTGAKAAYERLLQAEPRNVEALHGLAAIALSERRIDDAEASYLRILEADPRDAAATAGLVGLRSQGDPIAGESRIKSLLAAQPNTSVLHFALGNLHARQDRWSEAQQAYFKAMRTDPDNPDYLFNLAVSLDQLHQPRLAAHYYRQALMAAENQPAGFERTQVANRLRDLQP